MGKKRRKRSKKADAQVPESEARQESASAWIETDISGRGYQLWGLSRIPKKLRIGLWIAIILLAPFYSVFQGIDLTDVGRALVDYDNFLANGEYRTTTSWIWLSSAICSLWMKAFGSLGFISIKLGNVFMSLGTAGFAYYALRKSFGREPTLAALAVTTCFVNARSLVQWINYDTCSALFYTAGVAFLIRGLKERSPKLIGASGFTFLLLRYVRFSSILGLSFFVAIPLYYWLRNKDWPAMKRDLVAYGVGVLAGLVLMAGIGLTTGAPLVIPKQAVKEFAPKTDEDHARLKKEAGSTGYGVKFMAEVMLKQYWAGLKEGLPVAAGICVLAFLIVKVPRLGPVVLIGVAIAAHQWLLPKHPFSHFWNSLIVVILSLTMIGLGRRSPTQTALIFLGLSMMVCGPAGSNTGLAKASHTMWFAIPLALLCPFRWRFVPLGKLCLPGRPFAAGALIFAAVFIGGSVFLGWRNSYRDHPDRKLMNTKVDSPKLRGLYTFPERARVLQELVDNYEKHIAPDEYILTYGSAPGLHFILDRESYFWNSWTEQMFSPTTGKPLWIMDKSWERALQKERGAPVIIQARGSCRNPIWPIQKEKLGEAHKAMRHPNSKVTYILAWEGEFFVIYRPAPGVPVAKVKKE